MNHENHENWEHVYRHPAQSQIYFLQLEVGHCQTVCYCFRVSVILGSGTQVREHAIYLNPVRAFPETVIDDTARVSVSMLSWAEASVAAGRGVEPAGFIMAGCATGWATDPAPEFAGAPPLPLPLRRLLLPAMMLKFKKVVVEGAKVLRVEVIAQVRCARGYD